MCYKVAHTTLKMLIVLCTTSNLQSATEKAGLYWNLPEDQSSYSAVTLELSDNDIRILKDSYGNELRLTHIVFFRPPIDITVIAHEMVHVLSSLDSTRGEDAAYFMDKTQTLFINACIFEEIPLFYRKPNMKTMEMDTVWIY